MTRRGCENQNEAMLGAALAPGLIAHAVYEGHCYAHELEAKPAGDVAFKRYFHGPSEIHLQG